MAGKISKSIGELTKRYAHGAVVMFELPVESYFNSNLETVKSLIENDFEGIYISLHRPFKNLSHVFEQQGMDARKILIIDLITPIHDLFGTMENASKIRGDSAKNVSLKKASGKKQTRNPKCVHISPNIDIDELIRAIYTSIPKLRSGRKFIFIDSLTTITLYKPLSETMRFCEFLIRTIKRGEFGNVLVVFNVAKDLSQKNFIKDIALSVDEVINVAK